MTKIRPSQRSKSQADLICADSPFKISLDSYKILNYFLDPGERPTAVWRMRLKLWYFSRALVKPQITSIFFSHCF